VGFTRDGTSNPCKEWLQVQWFWASQTNPGENSYYVAPGAHFNWTQKHTAAFPNREGDPNVLLVATRDVCHGYDTSGDFGYSYFDQRVYSYKDVRPCG
jgi:hypothetical protein